MSLKSIWQKVKDYFDIRRPARPECKCNCKYPQFCIKGPDTKPLPPQEEKPLPEK